MQPQTKIIWHAGDGPYFSSLIQGYRYFRKIFSINSTKEVFLDIFASTHYQLFINGEYVCRGPSRCDRRWPQWDHVEIAQYLIKGKNVIAILCVYYGYGTGQTMDSIRGLAASLYQVKEKQSISLLATNETWKSHVAIPFIDNAPRINGRQGPIEIYDSRLEIRNWNTIEYDDAHWPFAGIIKHSLKASHFWNLMPRDIPMLNEALSFDARLIARGQTSETVPINTENKDIFRSVKHVISSIDLNSLAPSKDQREVTLYFEPDSDIRALLLYMFDVINPGYLIVEAQGPSGTVIDCIYAEHLYKEDESAIGKPVISEDNKPIDRFILSDERRRFEVAFGWKTIKYMLLIIHSSKGPVNIHKVGIRTRKYPFHQTGSFLSSNPTLNRIFDICKYTASICAQDGFLDTPGREQQQWIGDGRWTALSYFHLTGDYQLYRRMLTQIGQSQDWTGMIKPRHPDDHNNIPPIPAFCLSWISTFYEYHLHTGDLSLARDWWPNIQQALRWFTKHEEPDGLLTDVPGWLFIDWGHGDKFMDVRRGGKVAALNFQYIEALLFSASLATELSEHRTAQILAKKALRLRKACANTFWSHQKHAYIDCVVLNKQSEIVSEQTNALALLYIEGTGPYPLAPDYEPLPSEDRINAILSHVFHKSWIPQRNNIGNNDVPVPGSPFYMIRILQALSFHNKHELALEILISRYKTFLEDGSDTTWEKWTLFRENDNGVLCIDSTCHGWGASPIIFFMNELLGIKPIIAAYKEISFFPATYGLGTLKGVQPSVQGAIQVSIAGSQAEIRAPASIKTHKQQSLSHAI